MKVLKRIESRERCAEAGWFAFDYLLDRKIDKTFILSLRPLGAFVFLEMLSKPFFKIESEHFMIKGLLGDDFFRMAVHRDYMEALTKMEEYVQELGDLSE